MYQPIRVVSVRSMSVPPDQIGAQLLALENWKSFSGYGPLPGILEARFRRKTPEIIGTQIEVQNSDGSSHIEEIEEWLPSGITLRFSGFSAPLSRIADHFLERWSFAPEGDRYRVSRGFALYPKNLAGALLLRMVGPLMRRAVDRHLDEIERSAAR